MIRKLRKLRFFYRLMRLEKNGRLLSFRKAFLMMQGKKVRLYP